jgi:hypothetical protein
MRITALRELTNDTFTRNATQLDLKAHELNQITDAALTLRKYLMSIDNDTDKAADGDDMEMAAENNQTGNPDLK